MTSSLPIGVKMDIANPKLSISQQVTGRVAMLCSKKSNAWKPNW